MKIQEESTGTLIHEVKSRGVRSHSEILNPFYSEIKILLKTEKVVFGKGHAVRRH